MAASDELICSEVHTFTESTESDSSATRVSHFTFSNPLRISSHNDQVSLSYFIIIFFSEAVTF